MKWRWTRGMLAAAALLLAFALPWRMAFGFVQQPFVAAGTWISLHSFGLFEPGSTSSLRVVKLENERAAFAVDRAAFEAIKREDADLRARLAFVERTHATVVSADIVARTVGADMSRFAINRGRRDGIAVGMAVMVHDGTLAGKVIAVTDDSATVAAVTDRGLATAVSLLNGVRTIGVASGRDGTLMTLDYIPKEETVKVNDIVVTSGLEDAVPSGLVVGIVNAVESKETEPFQRAIIEPLADARRINSVSIIIGHAP